MSTRKTRRYSEINTNSLEKDYKSNKKTKRLSRINSKSKSLEKEITPEIEGIVNVFEWVPIPTTIESQILKSPIKIEDNDMFIYFLKRFLMQPYIRKHFVHKYRPNMDYSLIKLHVLFN